MASPVTGRPACPTAKRAFMMGNALVVGLVERVAHELIKEIAAPALTAEHAEAS